MSTITIVKRIVCLANSRKLSGRCIAGREWCNGYVGRWIRPVSAREHREVSEYERQYQDGSDPKLLDVIDIPILKSQPKDYQTENWLLDPNCYWKKVGELSWSGLHVLTDTVEPLWINDHRTHNGWNDKIPIGLTASIESSLKLVHLDRLHLSVFSPGEAFGNIKRRVQGRFVYAQECYALWVTDPVYERAYLAKPDGDYQIGECYLTISLGEPYNDACYKLIASIIVEEYGQDS